MAKQAKLNTLQVNAAKKFYCLFDEMQDKRVDTPARSVRLLTGGWTPTERQIKSKYMSVLRDQALLCQQIGVDLGELGATVAAYTEPAPSLFDSE
jgi:hypothetical protein